MSIQTEFQVTDLPTNTRVKSIRILNGAFDINGMQTTFPKVELTLVRCWPVLDHEGNPQANQYGQPMYKDSTLETTLVVDDPMTLIQYIGTLWSPMMDAAESLVATYLSEGRLKLPAPPLG